VKTLNDLIATLEKRTPHELFAYKSVYRTFRYYSDEFFTLIQHVAGFLHKNKLKKGDKAIIWGSNSPAWVLAFLGCVWHGVIVVPIDARQTPEFVKKIQKQVNAKIIFTNKYVSPPIKIKHVILEHLEDVSIDAPHRHSASVKEDDLMQILYTSGTTGDPKGVMLSHKNILSDVKALTELVTIESWYSFLSVLPLSHIFEQVIGLFLPLGHGARVVYVHTLKSHVLMNVLRVEKISIMTVVPRLLEALKNKIEKKAISRIPLLRSFIKAGLPHFKYFVSGGAPLSTEIESFWETRRFPIVQGYGLTETSPVLTCNTLQVRRLGSVGKAIPGVSLKIVKGELYCKGPTVFSGYYLDKKKTKQVFDKGWFKTGDLAKIDKEGYVYLNGRSKDVIVTSAGVNVYPQDIEQVLNKIHGVQSCVIGVETKQGEQVHAVLLLKKRVNIQHIVDKANKKLDSSQQIQHVTEWPFDDFPRTTTLKIKKFEVKNYVKNKKGVSVKQDKQDKLSRVLSRLTKEKIKPTSRLGPDLKLTSIDRVELASLLEQVFTIDIDEHLLISTLTVKDLEQVVREHKKRTIRPIRWWALWWPTQAIRFVLLWFWILFFKLFARVQVTGSHHLKDLKGPVVFAPNHQSNIDIFFVYAALPFRFSTRIAAATWSEYFDYRKGAFFRNIYVWLALRYVTLMMNSYLVSHGNTPKQSLEYTGQLLDKGWNILIYPEGIRTRTGKLYPFKPGIGLIGTEMRVPIVPIRVRGVYEMLPFGKFWPRRGQVRITIGKPLCFSARDSILDATLQVENAVQEL